VGKTPVERLVAAGLCDQKNLSERDMQALNSLSDVEVQQLMDLHQKLGKPDSDAARPFFPV
jgi:hypothetical protein